MKRKNLKKFRIDLNLKSKEMAEKLELQPSTYSNIENGKKEDVSIGLAYKLVEVFGVDDALTLLKMEE